MAEELVQHGIPAYLTRRDHTIWIIDRDGSIFEPSEELLEMKEYESCSTYIHIGTEDGWSLEDLNKYLKGGYASKKK